MRIKRISPVVLAALVCLLTAGAIAGVAYQLTCENAKCDYKGDVALGGGMLENQVTGYCTKCRKFVSVSWPREGLPAGMPKPKEAASKPGAATQPVGEVWVPASGQNRLLYKCPACNKPFLAIDPGEELKFCPKCHQETLKKGQTMMFD